MTPLLTQPELDALAKHERSAPNPPDATGHVYQRSHRMPLLVDRCCREHPGDLIELGCYLGGTTRVLVEIARKYNRKVVCIDPFPAGEPWHLDQIGRQFKETIKDWSDVVEFYEIDAHTPEARELIQSRRYCFAFSDDGHDFDVHVNELQSLLPVVDGMIAVDDVLHPGVAEAIRNTLPKFPGWTALFGHGLAEAWLLKNGGAE